MKHNRTTHRSTSPTYKSWHMMKQRCMNPNYSQYADYGGRGITVCDRWLVFDNFLRDMGVRPVGMTLDRKENDKGYTPENCRWATKSEQQTNRTTTHWIEYGGRRMSLSQWATHLGCRPHTLLQRLKAGWSVEKAVTTPPMMKGNRVPKGGGAE